MGGGGDAAGTAAAAAEDDTPESNAEDGVTLNIRCSNGAKFSVQINLDSTVRSFKAAIAENFEIPADQQRLIYKGRILKDDQTLRSYGLEADHAVHLVRGFAPASTNSGGNAGAANTTQTNTRTDDANEGGTLGGSGLGASPLPGLGVGGLGGTGGSFGGFPELEQMDQQFNRNPSMLRDVMNMPAVQSLMNNPEIMRNLIMNNPQMREIIDRNPELGHILNDPSTLRQTLEAARNPELMREMMRNTDRAMSNIESSPEGFNMLRRMYETVQEPFLNATSMAGNTGSESNPFSALLGSQGVNQASGGTPNQSNTTTETTATAAPNTNPLPNPWTSPGATGGAQSNPARLNPGGDVRSQAPAGLGGAGVPDLEGMFGFGAMRDPSFMNQLMQNPAISQMMQSILSNPQYMNQILGHNPQFRSVVDSNSQLREMMQNPEVLRQLSSPETMQQFLTLQQSLLSQLGRPQSTQEPGQTGGGAGNANNMGLDMLMNMFGGLGAGSLAVPNMPDVPPEQLYATQLQQLQEMGFIDTRENIRALMATAGNVHAAVERLLGNTGQ